MISRDLQICEYSCFHPIMDEFFYTFENTVLDTGRIEFLIKLGGDFFMQRENGGWDGQRVGRI